MIGKGRGRVAASAIALAGASAMLGAYAGVSSASQTIQRTTAKAASVTTVQFWSWDPNMNEVVAHFNRTHPDIKVVLSDINPEYAKLSAAIKAGNPPDVAQIEFEALPQYIATGSLLNLNSAGFGKYKADYPNWAWREVTAGGGLWALPQDSGPAVLFYRKDLFAKYHLSVPTTWSQFAAEAKQVHSESSSTYLTDFTPNDPSWLLGLMAQNGASWFGTKGDSWTVSIHSGVSVKVAAYWQKLLDEKVVKTDGDFTAQFWHDLTNGSVLTWMQGGWAADLIASEAPSTAGKWAVAQLPNWDPSSPASANMGGSTDVIFKSSKVRSADETFLAWLNATNSSWTLLYSDVHLVPTYLPAYHLPAFNAKLSFFGGQDLAPILEMASSRVNENFVWSPITEALYNEASDLYSQVIEGKGTLQGALANLQSWSLKSLKSSGFSVAP